METLKKIIESRFGVQDLTRRTRKKEVVLARRLYLFLLHDTYKGLYSLRTLAESAGLDNHASVIHNVKQHHNHCRLYPEYRELTSIVRKEWLNEKITL